jgi:ABC-type multidrug transport system ATPase subunit
MAREETALRVRGLVRRYGARAVLDGVDLDVGVGQVYGFLGSNGAGKTTMLRCVLGLVRPDAGEIAVFGESDPVRRRADVGAVVEVPAFHPGRSARDNLRLAAAWKGCGTEEEVARVLARVGLEGRAEERVGGYSLGMRQRLGLARAMLGSPKLLVLDEPTNGLDPRGVRELRDLLLDLARRERVAVLLSSHILAEVEQTCTHVGILDAGRVVAQGPVAVLAARARQEASAEAPALEVELAVGDRAAAARALEGLAGVRGAGEGQNGRVRLTLVGTDVPAVVRALVRAEVDVHAIVPVEARLEDGYLAWTRPMDGAGEARP